MAKWFVGPIMEKLAEKLIATCSEYLQDQLRWRTGMKKELERLQENLPKIQAVVDAASQVYIIDQNSPLNKWIWQLRDAIDEADDVLDDFEYMKHEEQLARNMARSAKGQIEKIAKRDFNIDSNLMRLQEIVHKLDKILAELSTFLHLLKEKKQEQQVEHDKLQNDRATGSLPTNVLIGRDQDKEFVIQWLRKLPNEEYQSHVSNIPNYNNIFVLSIVGPGGNGKTALLQHVYEDDITKEFDIKMWVCISNNFNVKKVIADIYESLKMTKLTLESLEALQKSLKSEVMSKKFLLVLDDIWEEDEERDKSKWETVFAPLAYGGLGSKILLTTRMSSVALMIANVIKKKNEMLKLESLKEDECLQLLKAYAFVNVENLNEHNKLRSIAGESITKLYGSPLAAKVLGGVLNSKLDERHWRNVLNNVLVQNGISSILELSYIFLPKYLQNCFAFCSIFAQDHFFKKDDLVRMWIAVGFIQPSYIRGETLEDIGERYFDILVKKSFFDKLTYNSAYTMHDLLHELAKKVSSQECFRVVDDEDTEKIPETIRHLSIKTNNLVLLKKKRKFKNLRTLCITTYNRDNQHFDVLTEIFKESRSIRLLAIYGYYQEMIPETIECSKHLRYFKFPFCPKVLLPRFVSNLYHLQFLTCDFSCRHDDFFPREMSNLSNLRYMCTPHLKFPGIGKLKFLRELIGFEVKNENGFRIEELEHMTDLHILQIEGLENVTDVQEACNAKLCGKGKLTNLSLKWKETNQNSADLGTYARVLDNLEPHNNLKQLTMEGYIGVRSAIRMNNVNLINNLEYIDLCGCLEWQILPPFGLLPFLKFLHLRNIPKAERFGNIFHGNGTCYVFPSLEVLSIENLKALVNWFEAGVDCLFPCLIVLNLYNCPNLQELPYLPPKLEKLRAKNIGWKTLNFSCSILGPSGIFLVRCCPNISTIKMKWEIIGGHGVLTYMKLEDCPNLLSIRGHQEVVTTENCLNLIVDELEISDASVLQMEPMRSIISVRRLRIEDDDGLASFPFEAERWFLPSLCELYLKNLKSLLSLPSNLTSLSSLEILFLENIPLLKSLPDLPPSLSKLFLRQLDNLNCLPSCLHSLSSLIKLDIRGIPQLRELPDLPASICTLKLQDLENLNSLPSCLPSLSSLRYLDIRNISQLRELPDLPPSLIILENLDNQNCLPSCLSSLSSLMKHYTIKDPQLQKLSDLSLTKLNLADLDNLPSCLLRISSLRYLDIWNNPQLLELRNLPPSLIILQNLDNLNCLTYCLPSFSSLTELYIIKVPLLRKLPDLPPSLTTLNLVNLKNLNNLPSCLPSLSSLIVLHIYQVPQLRELPDLPSSLIVLVLNNLANLNCLPSCLPSLSSLTRLKIRKVPQLQELPDLPPSLEELNIYECDPELMKLYE